MVRPLRKERKSAKTRTGKTANPISITPANEPTLPANVLSANSRRMTTCLHPSSIVPRLGCPLPLPLEKSHSNILQRLFRVSDSPQQPQSSSSSIQSTTLLSSMTRESLLRSQEALYDILLVRSTLTYWLHFAKVHLKKAQRKELIEAIARIRNVAGNQLELGGRSRNVSKPVIDNGLERYALFKYRPRSVEQGAVGHSAALSTTAAPSRPLFSWETLFEGLSSLKQDYQREVYEAKANIISYTLGRGAGNEVSQFLCPRNHRCR